MGYNRQRKPKEPDPVNGILLVDKPTEWTSHDVVAKIRNHFKFNKVGHGGTLDPLATGLLIVLIGKGTKLSQYVMSAIKEYEGTIHLGHITDSQDRDGKMLEEHDASGITKEQLEAEIQKYTGDIQQVPPMVSAIKKNGVALYKMARQGIEIEREPRDCTIYDFSLLNFEAPLADVKVCCSKGTYIRTLAHDIGAGLGVGGCLDELRRTASGKFKIENALTLDEILTLDRDTIGDKMIHMADLTPEDLKD